MFDYVCSNIVEIFFYALSLQVLKIKINAVGNLVCQHVCSTIISWRRYAWRRHYLL